MKEEEFKSKLVEYFTTCLDQMFHLPKGADKKDLFRNDYGILEYQKFRIMNNLADVNYTSWLGTPRVEVWLTLHIQGCSGSIYNGEVFPLNFKIPYATDAGLLLSEGDHIKMHFGGVHKPVHPRVQEYGEIFFGADFFDGGEIDNNTGKHIPVVLAELISYVISELSESSEKVEPIVLDKDAMIRPKEGATELGLYEQFRASWNNEPLDKLPTVPTIVHERLLSELQLLDGYKYKELASDELDIPQGAQHLGKGAYGEVLLGSMKSDNRNVAVKTAVRCSEHITELMLFEAHLLTKFNHKNIVKCLGAADLPQFGFCLVLEKWTKDLDSVIVDKARGDFIYYIDHVFSWMHQIAEAVHYLHSKEMLHRDLKPANTLIRSLDPGFDGRSTIAISDFGIANYVDDFRSTAVGSPGYAAPEIWSNEAQTSAVDVFSMGMIYYDLLMGKKRVINITPELMFKTTRDRPNIFVFDDVIMRMIERCWQQDPSKRPTAVELLAHLRERWQEHHQLSTDTLSDDRLFSFQIRMRRTSILFAQDPQVHQANITHQRAHRTDVPRVVWDISEASSSPLVGGRFGRLYKPERTDNLHLAIKVADGHHYTAEKMFLECVTILELQELCRHIVYCHGAHVNLEERGIVLEYSVHGTLLDLYDYLPLQSVTVSHVLSWLKNAMSALAFFDKFDFWLGSIGPHSFLIANNGRELRLMDLATLSSVAGGTEVVETSLLSGKRLRKPARYVESENLDIVDLPTWDFAAPELLLHDRSAAGACSDIYSTALVFREILLIMNRRKCVRRLLDHCLEYMPVDRPSAEDVREELSEQMERNYSGEKNIRKNPFILSEIPPFDKALDAVQHKFNSISVTERIQPFVDQMTLVNVDDGDFHNIVKGKFGEIICGHDFGDGKTTLIMADKEYDERQAARKVFMLRQMQLIGDLRGNAEAADFESLTVVHALYQVDMNVFGLITEPPGEWTLENVINGDLENLTVRDCCDWFVQAGRGLAFIHKMKYWHSDVRPKHFHLSGSSRKLKLYNIWPARSIFDQEGCYDCSPPYSANELHKNTEDRSNLKKYRRNESDVFSLGMIFWQMLTQKNPFPDDEPDVIHEKIHDNIRPARLDDRFDELDREIARCMHPEPRCRNILSQLFAVEKYSQHPLCLFPVPLSCGKQPVDCRPFLCTFDTTAQNTADREQARGGRRRLM